MPDPDPDPERKLTLTFEDQAAGGGRVPLEVVAHKLQALQLLLFHAAATVAHDPAARRGQWANRYREVVELSFEDAHHSHLTIETRLAEPDPTLFEGRDLGKASLDLAYGVARALQNQDTAELTRQVPDRQERATLLRQFESLAPRENEAFTLRLANGSSGHEPIRLTGQTRRLAQVLASQSQTEDADDFEEARIVGTLTKIHYDVAPAKLSVRVGRGHEVDCFYDTSLRDQVANLCAGSVVEVGGLGTLTRGGTLKQIDVVTDLDSVSMEPIRLARLEHAGRSYSFGEPVSFEVEFAEGVWAYANERLGVRGYAHRREDAFRELAEAFDYAYKEFALEEDEALDSGALELKRRLLALVEGGPVAPGEPR